MRHHAGTRNCGLGVNIWQIVAVMAAFSVFILGACVWRHAQLRDAALKHVEELPLRTIEFAPLPHWWPDWAEFPKWLRTVDRLGVTVHVSSEWMYITTLNEARELHIMDAPKEGCRLGDEELSSLRGFSNLQDLSIKMSSVTDDGLLLLRTCKHLKSISIVSPPQFTDGALRALKGMPVRVLILDHTRVTDAGLEYLGEPLEVLSLAGTRITDRGLSVLVELPLRRVNLCDTQVTFAGVRQLLRIATLKELVVKEGAFTHDEIVRLGITGVSVLTVSPTVVVPGE